MYSTPPNNFFAPLLALDSELPLELAAFYLVGFKKNLLNYWGCGKCLEQSNSVRVGWFENLNTMCYVLQ